MNRQTIDRRGLAVWVIAFLSFPIGGVLATVLIGHMDNAFEGLVGGFAAGLVIGGGQMLALRRRTDIGLEWIAATAVAMGLGVGAGVTLMGDGSTLEAILMRAIVTGLLLSMGQALILRQHSRAAIWWVPSVTVIYTVAWWITAQVIGTSVELGFVVFGSSGALVFQLLTGLALVYLTADGQQVVPNS